MKRKAKAIPRKRTFILTVTPETDYDLLDNEVVVSDYYLRMRGFEEPICPQAAKRLGLDAPKGTTKPYRVRVTVERLAR